MRAGVLALAIVLLALGASARGAEDDATVAVVVHTRGGDEEVTAGELRSAYDVFQRPYTIRTDDGTEEQPRPQLTGASLRTVLELAGVDPDAIGLVETRRSDRSWIELSAADVAADPPFPDGPPLVFRDDPATRFLRPVRGPSDANAGDNLATQPNQPLELTVRTGELLDVTAAADVTTVDAGDPVRFTAQADGPPGAKIAFDWDFGDSGTGTGASVEHAFDAPGTYRAIAHAVGDDDSAGASPFVTITVGAKPPAGPTGDDTDPTGDNPEGGLPGGPTGGNGNDGDGDPDGGPGLGSGPFTKGDGGSGAPGGDPAPGSTTVPGSSLAPGVVPSTATGTGPGGGGSEDASDGPAGDDRGNVLVTGRLLSATAAPSEGFAPAAAESAPTAQADSETSRDLLIVGGLLLLLALGGGRELGMPRLGAPR